MSDNTDFCRTKCCNIKGYDGSCCTVEDRNWIIGSIPDHMEVLERIRALNPEVEITWDDCFMTYEEGSNLFPDKPTWTNPSNYPCMRINMNSRRKGCVFYNDLLGYCTIYEARSTTCSNYKCEHLLEHLEEKERIEKGLELLKEQEVKEGTYVEKEKKRNDQKIQSILSPEEPKDN